MERMIFISILKPVAVVGVIKVKPLDAASITTKKYKIIPEMSPACQLLYMAVHVLVNRGTSVMCKGGSRIWS